MSFLLVEQAGKGFRASRRGPGRARLPRPARRAPCLGAIVKIDLLAECPNQCNTSDTGLYISSAPLDIERLANGIRGHWGRGKHALVLDVEFKEDLSRYRSGHGAKNMAIVRRLALGLLRANKSKRSVKTRRKSAGWNPNYLLKLLQLRFGLLMVI